ncbi:MAG TPA: M90 family metallopeptidase [Burkholderiaceae bacterium]|nr:M90 family metallopeptidase [Burkholderiaceae bacterium]
MLKALLGRSRGSRVDIPDAIWSESVAATPFVARLDPGGLARMRELASSLLAQKAMSGAGGMRLDATIQTRIAMQASLPILNLGLAWYRGWSEIVVYPSEFLVPRQRAGDDGVVHEFVETLAGESWKGGPLVLSWDDVQQGAGPSGSRAYNVVIHEFAHKLDQLDGEADGMPPFDRRLHAGIVARQWRDELESAFERLNAELDLIEAEMPPTIDPESDAADPYYDRLPLDPYAAQDPGEFFAVSSEAFFIEPGRLRDAFPGWYDMLCAFYRQQPNE